MIEQILTNKAITTAVDALLKPTQKIFKKLIQSKHFSLHNSKLIASLHTIGTVKTLFYGADKAVELHTFFINPKIRLTYTEDKEQLNIHSIHDLNDTNHLLFTGTVGQGKSIFMRYLALQELGFGRLPLFIELKYVTKQKSLENLIEDIFENWLSDVLKSDIKKLLNSGHITLFLDAFDELSTEFITDTTRAIETYCRDFPNLKIVLSTRPHHTISQSPHFSTVELLPYEVDEQKSLIHKLVSDPEARSNLQDAIEAAPVEIQAVLMTPLMVVLFIQKYFHDFSAPQNLTDFYANIFDIVVNKHNQTKTGFVAQSHSGLNNPMLEAIFTRFCFNAAIKNQSAMARQDFLEVIQNAWHSNSIQYANKSTVDISKIADDFQKYMCLVLQEGEQYTFIHKSIQEFYTAKFIANLNAENSYKAFNLIQKQIPDHQIICQFIKQLNPFYYDKYYLLPNLNRLKTEYKLNENNHINRLAFIDSFKIKLSKFNQKINTIEYFLLPSENFIFEEHWYLILEECKSKEESQSLSILIEILKTLNMLNKQLKSLLPQMNCLEYNDGSRIKFANYHSEEFADISTELDQKFKLWKLSFADSKLIKDYFGLYPLALAQCHARIKAKEQELEDDIDLEFE